jgi:methylmalonyl-CoA/ethylmalonyl-CoA epimerase
MQLEIDARATTWSYCQWREQLQPMKKFTLHHVGVAVRNLSAAIASYKTLFDYELISGPFDDPIQNVSVCFLSRGKGDTVIELVAPLGPTSPISLILKKGGGPYHLCYEVPNMNSAIDYLTDQGSKLLSRPLPPINFQTKEVAWLMTEAGLLVELLQA